ncbi:MAG TPA: group I intron-associated PD-(D/E)XK endonuclease [Solirubrobacteraceae bacterium]|nr:group I intron-associated PD-(D/E)XK endonuclease [Solirubrobacteraceae bacterium]
MTSVRPFPPPPRPLSNHPVDVGQRSEAAILAAFVERGFEVLMPWGTNHRYDMVLDLGDRFLRVQCKTGRLKHGTIEFRPQSVRSNTKYVRARPYIGEVEYFAVYCPATLGIYMVPCDTTTRGHTTLRLEPAANNQSKGIRWAADHELSRFDP